MIVHLLTQTITHVREPLKSFPAKYGPLLIKVIDQLIHR